MSVPDVDASVDALTLRLDDLRKQVSEAVERRDTAQQAAYRAAREADDLGAEWRRVKGELTALTGNAGGERQAREAEEDAANEVGHGIDWDNVLRRAPDCPPDDGRYASRDPFALEPVDRWTMIGRVSVVLARYRYDYLRAASLSALREMVAGGHYPQDGVPDPCDLNDAELTSARIRAFGLIDLHERKSGRRHDDGAELDCDERRPHLLADTPRCRA